MICQACADIYTFVAVHSLPCSDCKTGKLHPNGTTKINGIEHNMVVCTGQVCVNGLREACAVTALVAALIVAQVSIGLSPTSVSLTPITNPLLPDKKIKCLRCYTPEVTVTKMDDEYMAFSCGCYVTRANSPETWAEVKRRLK